MGKLMINKDMTISGTSYTLDDLCKKIDSLNTKIYQDGYDEGYLLGYNSGYTQGKNDAILNTQSAVTELDEKARKIEEELKETNSAKDEASQVLGLHKVTKDALENAKLRIDMLKVLKNSEVAKQSDIDTNEALLNNYLKELEEQKRKYNK